MNKGIALKILEINNNNSLSYDEKISQMERLVGNDIPAHINIKTGGVYGKRNCYTLEAYRCLNNFHSRQWIPSNCNIMVKQESTPIEFKILTKDNKKIEYSLYNFDQINEKAQNYLLKIGLETIEKSEKYAPEKSKNKESIGDEPVEEISQILKEPQNIKIEKEKEDEKSNLFNQNENNIENPTNKTLKNYLLFILDKGIYNTSMYRNNEIFKMRYGFIDNKIWTLGAVGNQYNLSRERIRQVISKVIRRIKTKCRIANKSPLKNIFYYFNNHLQSIKEYLLLNSTDNYLEQEVADTILMREFGSNDLIYLDLINMFCNTTFIIMQSKEISSKGDINNNIDIKKAILACIKEFSGKYGRSGIAKILKGSNGLKDNEHNNDSKNSKYYGMFKQLTLSYITSEIDELIKDEMLITTKVGFGRPILNINPIISENTDFSNSEVVDVIKKETYDENIIRVLHLIKQNKNVFITGHAGTGKSYILSKLKEKIPKLVITSTTGIAAVNVKGQTLHSWAGVGICNTPIEYTVDKILNRSTLKNQIQRCKILAIDEISMLDIKTFEYVDAVLKQVRNCEKPFGGIQVIFIGDFFQLPPVEKNENLNKKYCFESTLWQDLDLHTVLLTKNYRQNEENLITALSNMRTNSLTKADINLLKTREFKENENVQNALHIFATNYEADNYNNMKFSKINSKEYKLFAIDGVYKGEKLIEKPTNSREENILKRIDVVCSAEKSISLKIGVRVMLLINLDFEKGLINGSCGEVREISNDYILVSFDNGQVTKIAKHDFEFYNNEKLIALRRQFPLRLAYGITIHKSQGMSLDKLVVDCSKIFEKGQAYVALSRIKTLDGLYLCNFSPAKVMVDNTVVEFYKNLKIFDAKIDTIEETELLDNYEETILTEKSVDNNSIEYYVDIIRDIILKNNRWIEIHEIADLLGVDRHKKLLKHNSNSTIAHLIHRFLKKEGFLTKRINYNPSGYSIVVAPPDFNTETIPEEILIIPYKNRK